MSHWTIYFILKLDALCNFFHFTAFISGGIALAAGMGWFIWAMESCEAPSAVKIIKRALPACILLSFLYAITPTTKQAAAIYLIPKVVNNESVQNISNNTLKLLEEYTSDLLREMKDKSEQKAQTNGEK